MFQHVRISVPARPRAAALGAALLAGWLLALGGGFALLGRYAGTPGAAASPPSRWPEASDIPRVPGRSTLIMLLHPECPCSRASLRELERIVARSEDRVAVHVIFAGNEALGRGSLDADLRRFAEALPGVAVHADPRREEAQRFGAATSGQVVLYDPEGFEVFHGGITPARGHEGDSGGARAVLDRVLRGVRGPSRAPVFGCALAAPQVEEER